MTTNEDFGSKEVKEVEEVKEVKTIASASSIIRNLEISILRKLENSLTCWLVDFPGKKKIPWYMWWDILRKFEMCICVS